MKWTKDGSGGCMVHLPHGGFYEMQKFQGIFVLIGPDREVLDASTNLNHLMERVRKEAEDLAVELECAVKELKEFAEQHQA